MKKEQGKAHLKKERGKVYFSASFNRTLTEDEIKFLAEGGSPETLPEYRDAKFTDTDIAFVLDAMASALKDR